MCFCLNTCRAEGSSKIQSRLEQQTNRLSQQMKSGNGSKAPQTSSKSSPPKEKMSPASPMDDIEKGNVFMCMNSCLCSFCFQFKYTQNNTFSLIMLRAMLNDSIGHSFFFSTWSIFVDIVDKYWRHPNYKRIMLATKSIF